MRLFNRPSLAATGLGSESAALPAERPGMNIANRIGGFMSGISNRLRETFHSNNHAKQAVSVTPVIEPITTAAPEKIEIAPEITPPTPETELPKKEAEQAKAEISDDEYANRFKGVLKFRTDDASDTEFAKKYKDDSNLQEKIRIAAGRLIIETSCEHIVGKGVWIGKPAGEATDGLDASKTFLHKLAERPEPRKKSTVTNYQEAKHNIYERIMKFTLDSRKGNKERRAEANEIKKGQQRSYIKAVLSAHRSPEKERAGYERTFSDYVERRAQAQKGAMDNIIFKLNVDEVKNKPRDLRRRAA